MLLVLALFTVSPKLDSSFFLDGCAVEKCLTDNSGTHLAKAKAALAACSRACVVACPPEVNVPLPTLPIVARLDD